MPRQPQADSRRSRLEALACGRAIKDHESVAEMEDVPATVKRLHKVWSTAIARVRLEHPDRKFSCQRERLIERGSGNIKITLTIKRSE